MSTGTGNLQLFVFFFIFNPRPMAGGGAEAAKWKWLEPDSPKIGVSINTGMSVPAMYLQEYVWEVMLPHLRAQVTSHLPPPSSFQPSQLFSTLTHTQLGFLQKVCRR